MFLVYDIVKKSILMHPKIFGLTFYRFYTHQF